MKNYAVVNKSSGLVENIVIWDGLAEWASPDGTSTIETDSASIGWSYSDGKFSPPPEIQPSDEEIIQSNKTQKHNLMANAAAAMKPLEFSNGLGEATSEEDAQLIIWKKYILAVSRVDPEILKPKWPQWPGV